MNARLVHDTEHLQFREVVRDFVRDKVTP
ncbi:hypothetical protein Rwratislav_28882, partial [Rhodococcus wratislaviensis IFP 2016]